VTLRAVAEVNLAAIERNAALLARRLQPGTSLCAVVKGDAYGHGALQASRAALMGGATTLAVATAEEAAELRRGGLDVPILVLGALSTQELPVAIAAGAEVTAWDQDFVARLPVLAEAAGRPIRVHVKLDSGLGRLGTRDRFEALAVAQLVADSPSLDLAGLMTHFATSEEDESFVRYQLENFQPLVEQIRAMPGGEAAVVHAANTAAILRFPESHFDMVRAGIGLYGGDPMNKDAAVHGLEPALSLRSYVAAVKQTRQGDSAGYGRRFVANQDTFLATLPIGYADGVARALTNNCDVLIGGIRYPLCGTVSMDNITVDVGDQPVVQIGDLATLIGVDGRERQTAEDLARRIGTISYEVLCWISRRVPRVYNRDGEPV
jgi:alanine racemase